MALLVCGQYARWRGADKNPFEAYKELRDIEKHFQKCLPCLLDGSFSSQMEKEIQKLLMSAVLRALGIVLSWGTLLVSFLWIHRVDHALSEKDIPFVILAAGTLGVTMYLASADGAREFS